MISNVEHSKSINKWMRINREFIFNNFPQAIMWLLITICYINILHSGINFSIRLSKPGKEPIVKPFCEGKIDQFYLCI